jgi:CelD/BcsL family acetyltransferase involved in cellulose biosynthesis
LPDSDRTRAQYSDLLRHARGTAVYQTVEWLRVWADLGADLVFVEIDPETMVPFVCKGRGALRRAYSLPFDTYGGPVSARANGRIGFESAIAPLGGMSARIVDFSAGVTSMNGAARPTSTHIIELSQGYEAALSRYADSNRRLIRQALDHGVEVDELSDERELVAFQRMHLRTVARHGARPMPRRFFDAVLTRLVPHGLATFHLARQGDVVIAGNLVLRHGDRAYDWMWVYDERYLSLRATNLMIDRAVRDEIARGSRELNLGSSPNDRLGSVRFKQSFGAVPFAYSVYAQTSPFLTAARQFRLRVSRLGARARVLGAR